MSVVSVEQMNNGGTLHQGDTGTAVTQLKKYLNTAGYTVSSSGNSYDTTTVNKVKSFQNDYGAIVDGIVGNKSWMLLKKFYASYTNPVSINSGPNYKYGPNAPMVSDIKTFQTNLSNIGYTAIGTADGIFGKATLKAVLQFQLQNDMSIDGIAGSSTRQKAATISAYADNRKNWGKPYIGYKCADKKASMSESEVVARCIYGESDSSTTGQKAVAQIIANRVRLSGYPNTVKDVVFQNSSQFTSMYKTNGETTAPRRTSTKWANAISVIGSAFSSSKTYHSELRSGNYTNFKSSEAGIPSGATPYPGNPIGGNYFYK